MATDEFTDRVSYGLSQNLHPGVYFTIFANRRSRELIFRPAFFAARGLISNRIRLSARKKFAIPPALAKPS